jgi:3,4-dihydroxy-2-butanone 4-phosphate synthase/GTP cyclohydrolase II
MTAVGIGTVRRVVSTTLPTRWGAFRAVGFERQREDGGRRIESALAVILGDVSEGTPLLRVHSQCVTGEVLGSLRCDCREQLEIAMAAIAGEGRGLVIYEYQEGRGIGLTAKLQAYALQDVGLDTVEANHALGLDADYRDFSLPAAMLHELGIGRVRLLSNNPRKSRALAEAGVEVTAQIPCEASPTLHSLAYLQTKKARMGHALSLVRDDHGDEAVSDATGDPYHIDEVSGGDEHAFATIDAALGELRAGRMIVVVDDQDRENEGDLTMAAEMVTPEAINFMASHGRGLICLAMTDQRADELNLSPMAPTNTALGGTAFTVSIDAMGPGVTTGISAHDRAHTIRTAVDSRCSPDQLARPGHVFPLRARDGGVLERRGQTEAAVDLARLAGLNPAGVICEIVNDDGTMARVPDLIRFCRRHGLLMITVADLARYRIEAADDDPLDAVDPLFLCA